MYEYLVGCIILSVPAIFIFLMRKDLRKPMVWSGTYYTVFLTVIFIMLAYLSWLFSVDPKRLVTPGYWEPKTLFNVGKYTHGLAIEDLLFQLIAGGIAAGIYEFIFQKRISHFKISRHHISVLGGGSLAAFFFAAATDLNLMYALIVFGFAGTGILWYDRPDLIFHSLWGGAFFLIIYFILFTIFNILFPYFINTAYHLENLSGILIGRIPIEELLYAVSFGLMWSPLYEYEKNMSSK